jgi:hypothetical protein
MRCRRRPAAAGTTLARLDVYGTPVLVDSQFTLTINPAAVRVQRAARAVDQHACSADEGVQSSAFLLAEIEVYGASFVLRSWTCA